MGGITMGIMTLALSVFSVIPAVLSLVNRPEMAVAVYKFLKKTNYYSEDGNGDSEGTEEQDSGPWLWGAVNQLAKTWTEEQGDTSREQFTKEEDQERLDYLENVMLIFFLVAICLYLLYAIASILLMVVAAKGKARWAMMPWIVLTFLGLLVFIGACAATVIKFSSHWEIVILLAFALIECAVGIYLWLCIVSLFQVLGSAEWQHGNGASDWEMKPRFSTTNYSGVPQHE